MKNSIKNVIPALIGALLGVFVLLFFSDGNVTKYVSMHELFEKSNVQQKYGKELSEFEKLSNVELQNMDKEIRQLESEVGVNDKTKMLREQLNNKRNKLSEEYSEKRQHFDEIIWKDLNEKVQKYGREKGIDFILGATGDGSIMYAADEKDITDDLVKYINE